MSKAVPAPVRTPPAPPGKDISTVGVPVAILLGIFWLLLTIIDAASKGH